MEHESDLEAQQDELLALKSIYNNQELKMRDGSNKGIFVAHVQAQSDIIKLYIPDNSCIPNSLKHLCIQNQEETVYQIKHLPPIIMHFECPHNYPSFKPPDISLSCIWLSENDMNTIKQNLISEWKETKDVILFSWTSYLMNEVWEVLQLPTEFICPESMPFDIVREVSIYDFEQRSTVFSRSPHKCKVCFDEFKGSLCIQFLPCEHVFCKICMKSYFEMLINSGDVNNMLCPDEKCVSIGLPTQIKGLVDPDLYERYEKFLLQRTLDQMDDVVRCPRKFCQIAVLKEPDSNMAQCNSCTFIFCVLCEKTWHGNHTACELQSVKHLEIYKQWQSSNEAEREAIYKKYGRAKILRITAEIESAAWIKENSKPCPNCDTLIQLGTGCNKVMCTACHKYMCWLCGEKINYNDPYSHFRPGGPCENRLFEDTIVDDERDEIQIINDELDEWLEIVFEL